jgi:hypothetical protein
MKEKQVKERHIVEHQNERVDGPALRPDDPLCGRSACTRS